MKILGEIIFISLFLCSEASHWPLDVWVGVILKDSGIYFSPKLAPLDSYSVLGTENWLNPLFDNNDVLFRWNGNSSLLLRASFLVDSDEFAAERIIMVFRGVDTFAEIKLNDNVIGRTSNMYLRYIYDVKDHITFPKQNEVNIYINSSVKVAEELYNEQNKSYPIHPKCVPSSYNGECHVNHIRKMPASFGWDWGPAFPANGLWYVPDYIAFNSTKLFDITTDVELIEKTWRITITAHVENAPNSATKPLTGRLHAKLVINEDRQEFINNSTEFTINNGENRTFLTLIMSFPEERVKRWWPNDYGDQNLYLLNVSLSNADHIDWTMKMIGFRTVELVQEPLKKGLSFYFKVNGVPIFAKGSNLIPSSLFASKNSNVSIRGFLLRSAREARMNMMRVWGGGTYEMDAFYEYADEYGIMIWQDFMFACSMYPTTPEFLDSVREEVRQQVWRLKSHASVVVWAGNNENEAALYGNWYGTGKEQVYKDDYIKLYVDVVKRECENADRTRPFVVSSPSNGKFADENGWIGTNPYSDLYGDIHYYNYLADAWDSNTYKTPRFSSEYGFQSLPSIQTLEPYCRDPKVDLVRGSEFLKHRQHLAGGDEFMKLLISKNLRIPETNDTSRDFASYVYLSQVHQAMAVKLQTEHYRRAKSSVNDAGEGMTMGALYWQLNDVWQAPSWSSIDVDRRWKLLHYYAEQFFDPVIVTHKVDSDALKIFVVSDVLKEIPGCWIQLTVYKVYNDSASRKQPYEKKLENITVPANSVLELPPMSMEALLTNASCGSTFTEAKKKCIIQLQLFNAKFQKVAPINYVYPGSLKDMDLPNCELYVNIKSPGWYPVPERLIPYYSSYALEVTISTSCTQLFVSLDVHGSYDGRFSENGFHILDERKTIGFLYGGLRPNYNFLGTVTATSLGSIYS